MTKENISIATITLARDEKEESLLRTSLLQLSKLNLPVYITDGGSRHEFLNFLNEFPNFHLSKTIARGVWEQAKRSLADAYVSGTEYILYTEPDKHDFFHDFLSEMLRKVQPNENTGIILASRSASGFSTFPRFQQMTETTINNCCFEITGNKEDHTYGPFLLKKELVPYLKFVKEDIGWGWRPYTFGVANRLGYKVDSFIDDFSCPADQREDTAGERLYRMRQLSQNMQGIVLSAKIDLSKL